MDQRELKLLDLSWARFELNRRIRKSQIIKLIIYLGVYDFQQLEWIKPMEKLATEIIWYVEALLDPK